MQDLQPFWLPLVAPTKKTWPSKTQDSSRWSKIASKTAQRGPMSPRGFQLPRSPRIPGCLQTGLRLPKGGFKTVREAA